MDTPLYLASAAKLITCVAAAHCVQDGLVALDDDLTNTLHEFNDLQVIEGYDADGKVELEPVRETMTFRYTNTPIWTIRTFQKTKVDPLQ